MLINAKLNYSQKHCFSVFLWQIRCMKTRFKQIISIVVGTLLAGCAGMQSGRVLDTAGPAPGASAQSNSGSGTLIVYSAYQVNADFNSRDLNRREYSNYKILDRDKQLVTLVHNVTNDILQNAVPVELPPGKYFVVARSNSYGIVTVPVIIAAGRETVLHLDGRDNWPEGTAPDAADGVSLPDGEMVGWRGVAP
jgi:hypothetical protein